MNTDTLSTTDESFVSPTVTRSAQIPMTQKIAFGIGMLANQMFPAAWDLHGDLGPKPRYEPYFMGTDFLPPEARGRAD